MLAQFLAACSDQARSAISEKLHGFSDEQTAGRPRENRSRSHLPLAAYTRDEAKPSPTIPETKPEARPRSSISGMSGNPELEDFDVAEAITRVQDLASPYLHKQALETPSEGTQKSDEKGGADHDDSPQHAHKPEKHNNPQMASHFKALYPTIKQQIPQTMLSHNGPDKGATSSGPSSLDTTCKYCNEVKQAGTDQFRNRNWMKYCKACRDSGNYKLRKRT